MPALTALLNTLSPPNIPAAAPRRMIVMVETSEAVIGNQLVRARHFRVILLSAEAPLAPPIVNNQL